MVSENHSREFRRVYAEHAPSIARFLRAHCADADLVEDVLQETFVLVLRNLERFDPARGSMRSWIFKIAQNRLKSEWRREERDREVLDPDHVLEAAAGDISPEELITGEMTRAEIMGLINTLPEPERSVLIASKLEGLTLNQVAARLGLSNRTVSRRLFDALESLKRLMADHELRPTGLK